MSLTEYTRNDGDDYVTEEVDTGNQVVEVTGHILYYQLAVSPDTGEVINDGTDTETVTINVVDGLEVARGTDPADATTLDYSGDVTLRADGVETTKTLTNGSVSFDLTTEKTAGSEIEIEAVDLADHPAESDSATIEVIQA